MSQGVRRGRRRVWFSLAGVVLLSVSGACAGRRTTASAPATSTAAAAATSFVDGIFRSQDGAFSVALPARPEITHQKEKSGGTTLDVVVFDVAQSDREAYQVAYVDYPTSLGGLDPGRVLDGAAAGASERLSGALEESTRLTYLGRPAVDARISTALPVRIRMVLAGRRMYTLQQVGPSVPSATYERMLTSFRVH